MLSRSLLRAASVAALVALAGCGNSASPTQADPTALLAQAKATMEKASTVAFTLTSKAVPASSDGVPPMAWGYSTPARPSSRAPSPGD